MSRPSRTSRRLPLRAAAAALVALATAAVLPLTAAPAAAETDRERIARLASERSATDSLVSSDNISQLSARPSQVGVSGCFMPTAPLFVTSGIDSVRVWDVSDPTSPALQGVLPQALFENEAMTCGERRTRDGVRRFVLVGVDLVQASVDQLDHVNVGGGELLVVDVTDPAAPTVSARVDGLTSTHTVACVDGAQCRYAYSAGDTDDFSVFDLRDLDDPVEVDGDRSEPGLQAHRSPTGGHKWNFDAAGIGTHTGWNGASMWSTRKPGRPRLITTTGAAGRGSSSKAEGYNDFILHNSYRPFAERFRPNAKPRLRNGNILLVTEEDYEQTDCALAGSFQTWWVKRLDGRRNAIKPLAKVELADLGTFPLPQGAFCSSHWFDFHPSGLVAVGFYGGGTQVLDVRKPRRIRPWAHAVWGGSEVWDAMWVPVYDRRGVMTDERTNIVYSIDLVRGLDVYAVDLPGSGSPAPARASSPSAALPAGVVGGALAGALVLVPLRRRRASA